MKNNFAYTETVAKYDNFSFDRHKSTADQQLPTFINLIPNAYYCPSDSPVTAIILNKNTFSRDSFPPLFMSEDLNTLSLSHADNHIVSREFET